MNDDKKRLPCPEAQLLAACKKVVAAANEHQEVNPRLPQDFVDTTDSLRETIETQMVNRDKLEVTLSDMTKEQDAAYVDVVTISGNAKKTALRAFPGDKTRQRDYFGIGDGKGRNMDAMITRGVLIAKSLALPEVATAMAAKGWLAADTTKLAVAADVLSTRDISQETQKTVKQAGTKSLDDLLLELLECVKTIQNAARLQWDESTPANIAIRKQFLLDSFPPRRNRDVPTIPRKFTVKPGAAGSKQLKIDYNISKLASDYVGKILDKTTGTELMTFTTTDNKTTVTVDNATSGTAVQVILVARNDAGESKPTRPVTAKIP